VPISHPFIERLIGTIRREYLNRIFFWHHIDLLKKLNEFKDYYNNYRVHSSLEAQTPIEFGEKIKKSKANLYNYKWKNHCHGLFQTPTAA